MCATEGFTLRSFSSSMIEEVERESLLPRVFLLALNLVLLLSVFCFKSNLVKVFGLPPG